MKEGIHPNYVTCEVSCACGNRFTTRSVKPKITVDICSNCHPFFTGRQKFVDAAGRVERFQKRFATFTAATAATAQKAAPAAAPAEGAAPAADAGKKKKK